MTRLKVVDYSGARIANDVMHLALITNGIVLVWANDNRFTAAGGGAAITAGIVGLLLKHRR